jgi:protein-S-isoprenylcysteine O-methyltransferase Ste14
MIFYTPIVAIIFGAIIFIPANDFYWLEGWLFLSIFFGYIFLYLLYSLIKDPELLLKRGKYTTDDPNTTFIPDKTFMVFAVVVFVFIFIFPGIDRALNISPLPWFIELLGFIGMIVSLVGVTYINKVNRYASKGLVIHKDHELITSGPYRFVRHPMYINHYNM